MNSIIGQTLSNRYRVDDLIGRGAMSEVYKVWDEQRAVYLALKLLREDLAQDIVFLRRFKREAQTLARLQHPHIVRFYGLEQSDMLAYILMDHIEGDSLRAEIFQSQGKGLSPSRILRVMQPVCSALHYAHNAGVVHLDLKPGNIMTDHNGQVYVSDFGIARLTDSATATMVGMGTPAYMAPEQVRGEDPIPQNDIYALGVVLYEMLTGGERPFTGEQASTTGSTSEKVRWEQMNLQPPSPRQYNSQTSPELEAVVLKCLAKDLEDRYTSAMELLNAVESALGEQASQPIAGAAVSEEVVLSEGESSESTGDLDKPEQARKATRSNSILGGIGGIAIILLIIVVVMWGRSGGGPLSGLATPTSTNTYTATPTSTNTPTVTITPSASSTPTLPSTATPSITNTLRPTNTNTPRPTRTNTIPPPTATTKPASNNADTNTGNVKQPGDHTVKIDNETGAVVTIYMNGEQNYVFSVPPGKGQKIYVKPGFYTFTYLSCGGSNSGSGVFNSNWYWTFWCN